MSGSELHSGSLLKNGEYRIERTLGQGGFGITYEAEQVSLGRRVAMKEFFMKDICNRDETTSHVSVPSVGSKELVLKFKDKFIREAKMIAALDNEHIVRIYDVFEENGTAYYVMEYLGGGSLGEGVKSGKPMPESEAVESIRQIADALSYLHSKGIIHFDVKPSNVLRTEDGKLKLIDFGISKHYDESGFQTSSTPVGISKGFAPLEQYKQGSDINSFTPATDIYSLGATLFALLTGGNPPEASDVSEDGIPAIDGISPVVMRAIEKAMQPRRKDRPQSVAEFLAILDGTAEEDDSEQTIVPASKPVQAPQSNPSPKPVRKGFPKWLYGLIAGVAVAVLAVELINRPDKTEASDNLQDDSTAVVTESLSQKPATGKPSASASASKPTAPSKSESSAKQETPAAVKLKSISLSKSSLELEEGSSATLTVKYTPSNATDKTTTWKSSDASVAKVSTNGKVTAVKAGSATIIVRCGGKDSYCNVTVKAKELTGTHAGHEWVDLGLSVKWATCNVGASNPEGYGDYFAWGETSPKSNYTWATLKYHIEGGEENAKFSKYVASNKYGQVDNKTRLDLSDDAARVNWGGSWRMPTIAEFQELIDNCTLTSTTMNGKEGYKLVSKRNGNSMFLPAAGWYGSDSLIGENICVCYWSSSLNKNDSRYPYSPSFDSFGYLYSFYRDAGRSVRPVFR